MGTEEKGLLKAFLLYGADFQDADHFTSDNLKQMGEDVTGGWVSDRLKELFKEGLGVVDKVRNISDNYGKQLDITIKKVLAKKLKISKPFFLCDANTFEGVIERESWIVEKLMASIYENMDEATKREMAKNIEEYLLSKGFDAGETAKVVSLFMLGSITPLNALLATRLFWPCLPILLLRIFKLSFAGYLKLCVILKLFFSGPIGWGITAVSFLPLVTSYINPRAYDKFILSVFLIGAARMSQSEQ
jgi:hypothetical protein